MLKYMLSAAGETIQENPSIAAGSCIFLVAFSLVAANALYAQNGGHPVPLWATRDYTATHSVNTNDTLVRSAKTTLTALALDRIPVPKMRPQNDEPGVPASSLVREAQAHLSALGYYSGEVDGLYGPKTHAAIVSFETAYGYEASGLVSTSLLRNIGDIALGSGKQLSPAEDPIDATPSSAGMLADSDLTDAALIARVQIGLINFGEVEISADGVLGEETKAAISRFQQRYKLHVTGRPDDDIIRKLEDIGALRKS
ncbi:MAG: peptidoglycan-binding domain-containing protein [Rhizobiaceae bacterium]